MYSDKSCGMCRYCTDVCCDYGICELDFRKAIDESREKHKGFLSWYEALEWIRDNLHDMQEDGCDRFKSWEKEG